MSRGNFYEGLHGLRGLAAMAILVYHFPFESENLKNCQESLWAFVDLFFVMSGFVNMKSLFSSQGKGQSRFLFRRCMRLIPLLLATNLAYAVVKIAGAWRLEAISVSTYYSSLLESIFLTDSSPLLGSSFGINIVTWSISAELVCYGLAWVLAHRGNWQSKWIGVVFITVSGIVFVATKQEVNTSSEFGMLRALIGFGMGAVLFDLAKTRLSWGKNGQLAAIIGLALSMAMPLIVLLHLDHWPNVVVLALLDLGWVLVVWFISRPQHVNLPRFVRLIGDSSYGIYLIHPMMIGAFSGVNSVPLKLALVIGSTILFSHLSYRHFESPLVQKVSARLRHSA